MSLKHLKNSAGLSLVELLISGAMISGAFLAISNGLVAFQRMQNQLDARADSKIAATQLLMQIANFGRTADSCSEDPLELSCQVLIDSSQTTAEKITYKFTPPPANEELGTLTHTRNDTTVWSIELKEFSVTAGVELSNGIKLPAYRRIRLTTLLPDKSEFSIQTGFHIRNHAGTSGKRYAWSPMGGMQ